MLKITISINAACDECNRKTRDLTNPVLEIADKNFDAVLFVHIGCLVKAIKKFTGRE